MFSLSESSPSVVVVVERTVSPAVRIFIAWRVLATDSYTLHAVAVCSGVSVMCVVFACANAAGRTKLGTSRRAQVHSRCVSPREVTPREVT